jgi:hypothetical protein
MNGNRKAANSGTILKLVGSLDVASFLDSHKRDVLVPTDLKLKVTVTILLLDRAASLLVAVAGKFVRSMSIHRKFL